MEEDYGKYIVHYLGCLTTEEECCKFALKAVYKCCSKDSKFDDYFMGLGLFSHLINIMKSTYANDRPHILYYCVLIIAQLISSDPAISQDARHPKLMEAVLNVLVMDVHEKVNTVSLDCFRRFIFASKTEEIKSFVEQNLSFLDIILKSCHSKQEVKNLKVCLVMLNKILGDESENSENGERPFYEYLKDSRYI